MTEKRSNEEIVTKIREIARSMGWAIGTHGSMKRDIDLIAVPWVEEAVGTWTLYEAIRDEFGDFKSGESTLGKFTLPHGRMALMVIQKGAVSYKGKNDMDDWDPPAIDISFIDSRQIVSKKESDLRMCVEALKTADKMLNHVGCVQGCIGGAVPDGEDGCYQCQWCDEKSQVSDTLTKLQDEKGMG